MKRIFALLIGLIWLAAANGQDDTTKYLKYPNIYGYQWPRVWSPKVLRVPTDTVYSKYGVAILGGSLWFGDGSWHEAGGGGGSTLFALTGTNTATGAVVGELDGNTLSVQQGGNTFLYLDPTVNAEQATFIAHNSTGGGNEAGIAPATTDTQASMEISASFNANTNKAGFDLFADATTSTLTYTADTHTFNGEIVYDSPPAGIATDSILVWNSSTKVLGMRNASAFGGTYTASNGLTLSGSDFQLGGTLTDTVIIELNGKAINIVDSSNNNLFSVGTIPMGYYVQMTSTDNSGTNFANVQAISTDVGGHAVFEATYNSGTQIANIDAAVTVSTSNLSFLADQYSFSNYGGSTGVVTIQNLAGTGSRAVLADASGVLSAPVSDSTVKENIEPLEYGLETIEQFNPVSWNFKEGWRNYGEGKQIGFLAQDIAQVLPNSVFVTPQTGKMGYNETDLIPILVKAVQELNEQIKELKRNRK